MGVRTYLVEGVSCAGKTAVCHELRRRGHHAVNGDRELAYQGDPATGEPTATADHEHHLWHEDRVRALAADTSTPATFLCGGSRNHARFLDAFTEVFVLDLDEATLRRRLDERPAGEWGSAPHERAQVLRLHRTGEDLPPGATRLDATRPLDVVVDDLVARTGLAPPPRDTP